MQNVLLGRRTGLRVSNMAFGTGLLGSSPGGQQPGDVQGTLRAYADEEQIRLLDLVSNAPAGYPHELLAKVRS